MADTAPLKDVLTCVPTMESADQASLASGVVTVEMVGMDQTALSDWRPPAVMELIMMEVGTVYLGSKQ